jgi:hypothetical protein
MRFAIILSCLVLTVSTSSPAQRKSLHETQSQVMNANVSGDRWGVEDGGCGPKGNVFATVWKPEVGDGPRDRPLLMFDGEGLLKARISSSRNTDDPEFSLDEPTILLPDGGVARMAWPQLVRGAPWLTVFSAEGKLKSRVHLDPPGLIPSQLVVFPSGESLVSGLEHVHSRRAMGPYKSFTAIYDRNGHLQKQLFLPEDTEIDAAAERGDSRYARGPMFGNWAVSGGRARLGDDGNAYLMRRTSPATVYVISSSGELLRTLTIEAPDDGQMPYDMRVAEGRIAVEFLSCSSDDCQPSNFTVADAITGQKLADYSGDENLGGIFACYGAKPERFTFLVVRDNKLQMINVSAK